MVKSYVLLINQRTDTSLMFYLKLYSIFEAFLLNYPHFDSYLSLFISSFLI